ncbi:jg12190 [Pararge aegeria aegeria]|uniref:Jg12190 protein n=1 Tax=Pararge aegeria aegeria TaxID=348720 RepID=A0A8S4RB88_9NEOP|nr:jg12190 [Pararge aegeria aegeria]
MSEFDSKAHTSNTLLLLSTYCFNWFGTNDIQSYAWYNGVKQASREAEVAMGGAHSSADPVVVETFESQDAGDPALTNVGGTPARWKYDIKPVAGSRLKQAAQDRGFWNSL